METILDASAVLAWAFAETAAEAVEEALADGVITVPNWSEVLQKVRAKDLDPALVGSAIRGFGLRVVGVDQQDAEQAAALWHLGTGLSLADRFCITVGRRLDVPIWTCDRSWTGVDPRVVLLR